MMEISQSDPVTEWNSSSGQTGLEEPMWQLGLGVGSESYPQRPDEADCIYYLRTGFCGYGSRCRFNHPPHRRSVAGIMRPAGGEYPERIGQPVCQYYMRTGMCKFGASCKYHHPRQGQGSSTTVTLNISGYPLRPGEKECSYYVKTGQCKFGVTCKFHHPQPTTIISPPPPPPPPPPLAQAQAQTPESLSIYPSMQSSQQFGVFSGNWPLARPSLLPGSYTYGPVILPSGMVPFPGWNPYQASVSSVASPSSVGGGSLYAINPHFSPPMSSFTGSYVSMPSSSTGPSRKEDVFPERPGEPECQYFLKTGDCRFGSSCRYHHPREWSVQKTNVVLSPMGLPLRPGAPLCSHYAQKGVCKFGASCRFDHPMGTLSYNTSASSVADIDMAVAPYPVGSSTGTLPPLEELVSGASRSNEEDTGSSLSKTMPLGGSTT